MRATQAMALAIIFLSASAQADIHALSWLTGCWALDGRDPGSTEQWMAPAGKSMLGVNRTVSNDQTVAFEFMRIIEDDDGNIIFIALPSGQEKAKFTLTAISDSEVVFENPQHDFPQKIIYRQDDENSLVGRIEGMSNGSERAVDFPMTRTDCGVRNESE
jgi:hypothetical protein